MIEIYGFEGRYKITEDGRIYSLRRKLYVKTFDRIRRGGGAIPSVALYDDTGTRRIFFVHRLVALHFVPNPAPQIRTEVNHIDGDVLNAHYTNLEWLSRSENQAHAFHNGLHPGFRKKIEVENG